MTPEEQAGWDYLNRRSMGVTRNGPPIGDRPCEDCTAEYAAENRALGLCVGFPGPQRYCRRCMTWRPDDRVHWAPYGRPYRNAYACLSCRRKASRARWYRRMKADPVRFAAHQDTHRRWYARADHDRLYEYKVAWAAEHDSRVRGYRAKWRAANAARWAAYQSAYLALRRHGNPAPMEQYRKDWP